MTRWYNMSYRSKLPIGNFEQNFIFCVCDASPWVPNVLILKLLGPFSVANLSKPTRLAAKFIIVTRLCYTYRVIRHYLKTYDKTFKLDMNFDALMTSRADKMRIESVINEMISSQIVTQKILAKWWLWGGCGWTLCRCQCPFFRCFQAKTLERY